MQETVLLPKSHPSGFSLVFGYPNLILTAIHEVFATEIGCRSRWKALLYISEWMSGGAAEVSGRYLMDLPMVSVQCILSSPITDIAKELPDAPHW